MNKKENIANVAFNMFLTSGYNNTSTKEIIENTKIARGTLYYYFTSKEDILDYAINMFINELIDNVTGNINSVDGVSNKISTLFKSINLNNTNDKNILDSMHKVENSLLHEKMNFLLLEKITPIFSELIIEGNKQNIFNCAYPIDAAQMIFVYINTVLNNNENTEQNNDKFIALAYNISRLLECSIDIINNILMDLI